MTRKDNTPGSSTSDSRVVTSTDYTIRKKASSVDLKETLSMTYQERNQHSSSAMDYNFRSPSSRERATDAKATLSYLRKNEIIIGIEKMSETAKKYKHTSKYFSSFKLSSDGKGREAKLIKMRRDLEEAQVQIRSLMGQLGQGLHWWGSFL